MSKILYIFPKPYPWDVRAEKICQALSDRGFEVCIAARYDNESTAEERIGTLQVLRIGKNQPRCASVPLNINPLWKRSLQEIVRRIKPAIIITREMFLARTAAELARPAGIAALMDMAEHYPAAMRDFKKYNRNPLMKFFVKGLKLPDLVEAQCVPLMDGIMTVCDEQNDRLHTAYGVPPEKLQVVHNTPDLAWFAGVGKKSTKTPRVFGHHGYMSGDKRLDLLVRGFLLAAKSDKDIELLLAGSGDCVEDLLGIVRNSKYRDRIRLTGPYRHEELAAILGTIDIGVLPYQVSEFNNHTIHNKIFDYFAAGKPVIVSPARPLVRIVGETGTGIVLKSEEPAEMAETMLSMRSQDCSKYSENGLSAAENKYNWRVDSDNMISFVKRYL